MGNPFETPFRAPPVPPEASQVIRYVEGKTEKSAIGIKPEEKELSLEGLEAYRVEAQELIDSYRNFFSTFARDVSATFHVSDKFLIDLATGRIHLDVRWFAERECSKEQIIWAVLHELSHFRDLTQDPEGMKKAFDAIRKGAKKTGETISDKIEQAFGASDPELVARVREQRPVNKQDPTQTMSAADQAAYRIHHTFYNIFDDIYVNKLVSRHAPRYEDGEPGGQEVTRLYREKLFKGTDLKPLPRHLQFLYTLLRHEMVPDEPLYISREVRTALETTVEFQRKKYSIPQLIETYIKPHGDRENIVSHRHLVLRQTLEPIFLKLLQKDLDEWEPERPSKEQAGEAHAPFQKEYDAFDQNSPDQIGDQEIRQWFDQTQGSKTPRAGTEPGPSGQEPKTPERPVIGSRELQEFKALEQEVAPHLEDLSKLWRHIVFGTSRGLERKLGGGYRTGVDMDMPRVIEAFPDIEKRRLDDVRVMRRMELKETLVQRPELIRVRVLADMSGSMAGEEVVNALPREGTKMHILRQATTLLLSSVREFNAYLNLTRTQTRSPLVADSEVWSFGSLVENIKPLRGGMERMEEEFYDMVNGMERLKSPHWQSNTYDHLALDAVLDSFSPQERKKMVEKKNMEIVFEITDGGSSHPVRAREAVDALLAKGVVVKAFLIGDVSPWELETFNRVWNNDRTERCGEVIGTDIGNLLPAVTSALKRYLGNVRL